MQNFYVKSIRTGLSVFDGIRKFLWRRLKLRINEEKSAVVPARQRKFLGYAFIGIEAPRIRLAKQTIERFKERIREVARGHRSQLIED
jgi:hypothetical protein